MEGMSKMEKKKGEMGLTTFPNMEMVGTTSDDVHGHGHDPPLRSESSSSIGQPDDDDEEEVQSTLSSLASLEDSLPIKKGLSKFYGGKSKSYGNLGEVKSLEDLGKSDNPFNKRRRTLLAYNRMFSDHSSSSSSNKAALFYAHSNHLSMPLLPLAEDDDDHNHNHANDNDNDHYIPYPVNAITSVAAPTSPS